VSARHCGWWRATPTLATCRHPAPDVAHKLDVLRAHCDAEGRDYNTIRKTAIYNTGPVLNDRVTFLVDAKQYAALGISQLDVLPDRNPVEYTERLAEVIPRLAEF
jgi:hypothetical protein